MSYETLLLPNFSPDGKIILAKEQFHNSNTFWAMPILIFSPFANFGKQSLIYNKELGFFTLKLDSESCFIYLFHIMVKWIPRIIMCWGAKCSREKRVLRSKVFQGAKGVWEQSVLRSKLFHGGKGVKEQSVLRSKVFQGAKGVEKHSVLRNKVFWEVKSVEEEGVMRSKGFWVAKGVKEQGVLRSKLWLCHVC